MKEIHKLVHEGHRIAHIVDGPRGPLGIIKPGLLLIAQISGMPIIPTITSAEKKWTFNSWDRFIVPKPFSRIIIRFGDEIYVPKDLKGADFDEKRSLVERTMKNLYIESDSLWSNPEKIDRLFNSPS